MNVHRINPLDPLTKVSSVEKTQRSMLVSRSESIKLSEEAREASLLKMAADIAMAAPEVRRDRVEAVKKQLADPNYISCAINETAEKVMEAFGL